jgi:ribosome-interacting GTPase 1
MPANLTPQYKAAEERFKAAESTADKIDALREMLAIIPKHKGTEKLQADLKRRLAKLQDESEHERAAGHKRHDPGRIEREGAGQIVLLGAPNSGKSSLLGSLTRARPEIGPYPFTTRTPHPGMMAVEDVQVQLVDTPPVTVHGWEGYMVNIVQQADAVALVCDVGADDMLEQPATLASLLARARVAPADLDEGASASHDVTLASHDPRAGGDAASIPDAWQAPSLARRVPVVALAARCDLDPDGTITSLLREVLPSVIPVWRVSVSSGEGLDTLPRRLYDLLGVVRVYTKEPGKKTSHEKPFTLPAGSTVWDLAQHIHKDLAQHLRFARIWGSGRFDGQTVERSHLLQDGDVVELHAG